MISWNVREILYKIRSLHKNGAISQIALKDLRLLKRFKCTNGAALQICCFKSSPIYEKFQVSYFLILVCPVSLWDNSQVISRYYSNYKL